jgi:ATP-dependent protease HslVU (ClpYQ) peptidase subunit
MKQMTHLVVVTFNTVEVIGRLEVIGIAFGWMSIGHGSNFTLGTAAAVRVGIIDQDGHVEQKPHQ